MDREYASFILSIVLEQFDRCQQQITANNVPLDNSILAPLSEFRASLVAKIEEVATDPIGNAAIDYYGKVAARWIRRYAPGLTPHTISFDNLMLVIEEIITSLEMRHSDTDRWDNVRSHVYDDWWLWDKWTLRAVSEMVSYSVPTLIAKRAGTSLQSMGVLASNTAFCNDCGYPKDDKHICPYRY